MSISIYIYIYIYLCGQAQERECGHSVHVTTVTFIFYTMHLSVQFNHLNHALWVAVQCEASEATHAVAEASKASKATCNWSCDKRYSV